jgi:hypothetical protein
MIVETIIAVVFTVVATLQLADLDIESAIT